MGLRVPSLESEIELIRVLTTPRPVAVTLNSKGCMPEQLDRFRTEYRGKARASPSSNRSREGADALVPAIRDFIERERSARRGVMTRPPASGEPS